MTDWGLSERSIFEAAIEKPLPEERAAYLDQACGGNLAMRQEVEALLAAHDRLGGITRELPSGGRSAPVDTLAVGERPGTRIGPYKLLQQIGEGGMGTVFMAEQTQPVQRKVALKVIKPGMDSNQVIARFEAERQALALMDHPNIARVFDAGTTDAGRPFFVMELIKGVPITKYCDEHHLTPKERLELFVPVCQAVQHAHQKGIIHRDLKPSNVLVALYDGQAVPKVIDFGVAKATGARLTERTLFTEFGAVVGTLEYMAPEQAELNQLDIDTRSDIYALGVLMYELLTGTTPLERKRLQTASMLEALRIIREEEPPKPSTRLVTTSELPSIAANRGLEPKKLSGLVQGELDWIVMKALEKDRSRRYETANALARDVAHHLNDEPVQACPPSAGYRFRKLVRRNKAAFVVAATISLILVVGAVVSTALAVWAIRAEGLAEARLNSEKTERERAVEAGGKAREAEREGKRQLVGAKLAQARAGRWSRQPGQRFDGLKALTEATALARELGMKDAVFDELRDEMVACLALADIRLVRDPWQGWPVGSSGGLGFDADLERYARSDSQGNIEVRQVEGDRLLARLTGHGPGGGAARIRFSPDGRLLVVDYWGQIPNQPTNCQVWDWQRKKVVFQPKFSVVVGADFRPDGKWLSLAERDGTITVYAVDDWKEANKLKTGFHPTWQAFHPDGTRLAVASQSGTIQVWELVTGKLLHQLSAPGTNSLAWHPGGDLLAVACGDWTVRLYEVTTGQWQEVFGNHQNGGVLVTFAAGGDLLVSTSWDGTTRLWDPWSGRELLRFMGDTQHVSRDGRRLASRTGHTLSVWELNPGREHLPLPLRPGTNGKFNFWSVSPDSRWLVGGSDRCRVWDLARRKQIATLPGSGVRDARFHPKEQEFFTEGRDGLFRWSFAVEGGGLRIRPTDRLLPPGRPEQLELDRDGRRVVVSHGWVSRILDLENPPGQVPVLDHQNSNTNSISPDGRWVATGTQHGLGVRVWDARTGKRVTELLPDHTDSCPKFSPDGRWLLIATGTEFGIWEAGTWRPIRQIPREQTSLTAAAAAFAPDGKVLAVAVSPTMIRLFDTTTWRPLARLQGPDADLIGDAMGFTPDGTRLLVPPPKGPVRIWDLRRIREQLAEAGLDWGGLAYPPPPPPGEIKPIRIEVDVAAYGDWAKADQFFKEGYAHSQAGRWELAAENYSRAIELDRLLGPAWFERAKAHFHLDRYAEAVADFSRAIELQPARAEIPIHLGLALAKLSRTLLIQKKFVEAEPLMRKCLALRLKYQPDDWLTCNARSMLGAALLGQHKYAEAEPLLVQACEGMKQREASLTNHGKVRLIETLEYLVDLYEATGQKDKAAAWRKKLKEGKADQKKPQP